ncbi:MAG: hypothetical protein ACYC3H_04410 [Bellilinea sp.]
MEISPEVLIPIIIFISSGLLAFIKWQFNIHRSNKIFLKKTAGNVISGLQGKAGYTLSFILNNVPINNIHFTEYELTNGGFVDIEELELVLKFIPEGKFDLFDVQVKDKQGKTELVGEKLNYVLSRPYLNMVKKDKEEKIFIHIFSDTQIKMQVFGGGKGWKVEFIENQPKIRRRLIYFLEGYFWGILISTVLVLSERGLTTVGYFLIFNYVVLIIYFRILLTKFEKMMYG